MNPIRSPRFILYIVGTVVFGFLPYLGGCSSSGGYSGSASTYYRHDPWRYDTYWRNDIHYHHHNRDVRSVDRTKVENRRQQFDGTKLPDRPRSRPQNVRVRR